MTLRLLSVPFAALALVACGGSPPAESPPSGHHHGAHHGEGQGHGHGHGAEHKDPDKLSPELKDFHAVLSPLWHMDKGPGRADKTCAEVAKLQEKADGTKDAELTAAVKALGDECAKEGRAEFDARFTAVHERFHALAR
ncbi:MAG: hypothetical protein HS104_32245 [Polyangiaceae bacterium]|nr:hypothetical protein [Polyangiaceae bacterium]MCE7892586.1 hypothetical protein [Sorangiineae bacterium PRO1]MCL4749157.1 hypothetical protein [Myxococcales bacterium]